MEIIKELFQQNATPEFEQRSYYNTLPKLELQQIVVSEGSEYGSGECTC